MTVVAGFDRSNPPATGTTMPWLIDNTNLGWVGYYLVSPNHSGTGWVGQFASLSQAGWSVSPIYVGQQDPIYDPENHYENPSTAQGIADANDAVNRAWNEGFTAGTIIYLDVEYPEMSSSMRDYVQSWCQQVQSLGYAAGIYIPHGYNSTTGIELAHSLAPSAYLWVAHIQVPGYSAPSNTYNYPIFSPTDDYFAATVWQYQWNYTIQTINGPLSPTDLNVEINQLPRLTQLSPVQVDAGATLDLRQVISIVDRYHTTIPNVLAFDRDGTIVSYEIGVVSGTGHLNYEVVPVV